MVLHPFALPRTTVDQDGNTASFYFPSFGITKCYRGGGFFSQTIGGAGEFRIREPRPSFKIQLALASNARKILWHAKKRRQTDHAVLVSHPGNDSKSAGRQNESVPPTAAAIARRAA